MWFATHCTCSRLPVTTCSFDFRVPWALHLELSRECIGATNCLRVLPNPSHKNVQIGNTYYQACMLYLYIHIDVNIYSSWLNVTHPTSEESLGYVTLPGTRLGSCFWSRMRGVSKIDFPKMFQAMLRRLES